LLLGGLEGLLGYYGDTLPMNLAPGYGDTNASMHGRFCRPRRPCGHREKTGEGQHVTLAESYAVTNLIEKPSWTTI